LSDYGAGHAPRCFAETLRAQAVAERERRFWQASRHAEAITGQRFWRQKLDSLHDNPCRKGLVVSPQQWRYSSAA
jgi:putative transposase